MCEDQHIKRAGEIEDEERQAEIALEIRELLSAFIDAQVLRGHALSTQQWERACFLCGRWCPPFTDRQFTEDDPP